MREGAGTRRCPHWRREPPIEGRPPSGRSAQWPFRTGDEALTHRSLWETCWRPGRLGGLSSKNTFKQLQTPYTPENGSQVHVTTCEVRSSFASAPKSSCVGSQVNLRRLPRSICVGSQVGILASAPNKRRAQETGKQRTNSRPRHGVLEDVSHQLHAISMTYANTACVGSQWVAHRAAHLSRMPRISTTSTTGGSRIPLRRRPETRPRADRLDA